MPFHFANVLLFSATAILFVFGSLVAGLIQYVQMLRQIHISVLRTSVTFYVSLVVVVLGFTILLGIAANVGPF